MIYILKAQKCKVAWQAKIGMLLCVAITLSSCLPFREINPSVNALVKQYTVKEDSDFSLASVALIDSNLIMGNEATINPSVDVWTYDPEQGASKRHVLRIRYFKPQIVLTDSVDIFFVGRPYETGTGGVSSGNVHKQGQMIAKININDINEQRYNNIKYTISAEPIDPDFGEVLVFQKEQSPEIYLKKMLLSANDSRSVSIISLEDELFSMIPDDVDWQSAAAWLERQGAVSNAQYVSLNTGISPTSVTSSSQIQGFIMSFADTKDISFLLLGNSVREHTIASDQLDLSEPLTALQVYSIGGYSQVPDGHILGIGISSRNIYFQEISKLVECISTSSSSCRLNKRRVGSEEPRQATQHTNPVFNQIAEGVLGLSNKHNKLTFRRIYIGDSVSSVSQSVGEDIPGDIFLLKSDPLTGCVLVGFIQEEDIQSYQAFCFS